MLNIQIFDDSDARAEGDFITPDQSASLEARVERTGSDRAKFLKVAGAESFAKIRTGRYTMLDSVLLKKERTQQ